MSMFNDMWMLVDGEPVRAPSPEAWAVSRAQASRTGEYRVGGTDVGDLTVSTVFLGIDHSFSPTGPPLLYETMVFENGSDIYCERFSTRAEAENGHAEAVAWAVARNVSGAT